MCVFVLYSPVSLSCCSFLDILHCLPCAVEVPLESALNLVSRMSPCGAHDTHSPMQFKALVFSQFMCWARYPNQEPDCLIMRYDVAKCWVSEQEGVRAHARIVFVDSLFIRNVRDFKEFVGRLNNTLHTLRL